MSTSRKTAVIVGASGGIGSLISKKIAKENIDVILLARNVDVLSEISTDIKNNGGHSTFYKLDITNENDIEDVVNTIIKEFKTMHFLVYCAGTGLPVPAVEVSNKYLDEVLNVNFKGFFLILRQLLPIMIAQKYGRIIGLASINGKKGLGFASIYSASKAAMINLCQSISCEIAQHNVTINTVCPAGTQTNFSKKAWKALANYNDLTYEEYKSRRFKEMGINREIKVDELWPIIKMLLLDSTNATTGQSFNLCGNFEVR